MASLLSRFTTFVPNTTILSNDHNQELNRIVNLLNGTTTNLKTVLKTSDAGDPPLELDQLSTGPIMKGFQGGVEKFRFRNDGSLRIPGIYDTNDNEQLLFSLTASAVNEFTMKNAAAGNPPQLQATGGDTNIGITLVPKGTGVVKIQSGAPAANEDAANKAYVDGKKVSFSSSFHIADPSTATVGGGGSGNDFGSIVIPAGGSYTITKFAVVFHDGSHTSGGSLTFQVFQFGVGVKSTAALKLDNTNSSGNVLYPDDIGDFAAAEGTILAVELSARSGTITERNVTVIIEGFRTVF